MSQALKNRIAVLEAENEALRADRHDSRLIIGNLQNKVELAENRQHWAAEEINKGYF